MFTSISSEDLLNTLVSLSNCKVPFFFCFSGNAILLIVTSMYHHIYSDLEQRCLSPTSSLSPNNVIGAIMTLESGILIPVFMTYIGKLNSYISFLDFFLDFLLFIYQRATSFCSESPEI